ncbi:tetratricopeptide repeat protein [Miniphocaeibacter halophilus]|uniref:Uncharacterized protein n=1 Tax=Miniphocaeibacter halophilus TaxID=2931922 RepID=A0AC61MSF5_9FIRM|nr:hypothetical protein [Miniphocaeibacter halophilus]QQK07530.1 hypothetical protein JFY71_09550 [Miniphocaeibacter halophilus]
MENIKDYYSSKSDEILYLELKESLVDIDFPLPILKKDFTEEIKSGTFNEEIEFKYFFRGIIFNLAVDFNFKYAERYFDFLFKNITNLKEAVLNMAIYELQDDVEISNIFLKFNYDNFQDVTSNYYYTLTLLELYESKNNNIFLEEAEKVLNKNISIDEKYPLTYFLLGNIELNRDNLIKANYYYLESKKNLKNLNINNIEEIEKEIDNKLDFLQIEVILLESKYLLENGKFYEVIEKLENNDIYDYRKYYYLANAYFALMENNKAFKYYSLADDFKNKEVEFYIDYSYFLSQVGYIELTIEIIEKGLKEYEDNEILLFNRAVIFLNLGENRKAKEDLENIVQYYDISEDIFNNAMILLEQIQDE